MPREFDAGKIPGSDVEHNMYIDFQPLPKSNGLAGVDDEWLPKTDWGRDKIIASDD